MRWGAENDFDSLIVPLAQQRGLEVALVKAIIGQESGFKPDRYHFDGPDPALNASYGLMQVEGVTARAYGFTGDLSGLYDPATCLEYGTRDLADELLRNNGAVSRAISAYNGGDRPEYGFGTPFPSGLFGNQDYVDRVLDNLAYFRAQAAPPAPDSPPSAPSSSSSSIGKQVALVVALLIGLFAVARFL